jgi:hypothetical protein
MYYALYHVVWANVRIFSFLTWFSGFGSRGAVFYVAPLRQFVDISSMNDAAAARHNVSMQISCDIMKLTVFLRFFLFPLCRTPLYLACQRGELDVVELIIATGAANIETADNNGWSPLFVSCFNGKHGSLISLVPL